MRDRILFTDLDAAEINGGAFALAAAAVQIDTLVGNLPVVGTAEHWREAAGGPGRA